MRTSPFIVLIVLAAACDNEPPIVNVYQDIDVQEVPEDEGGGELACEPTSVRVMSDTSINGWTTVAVSDDLVAHNVWYSSWVPNTTSINVPIHLETLLGCAPVEVYGLTFSVHILGDESEARSVENFDMADALVITRQVNGQPHRIGEVLGGSYYTSVREISDQFGGEETWQGFASASLTGSQPDVAMQFEPFFVQPDAQEQISVVFTGVDKLPLGSTFEMEVNVFYEVDGHIPEPKRFTMPVLVYVPQQQP